MKLQLTISGGLAGISRIYPVIDSSHLSVKDQHELSKLIVNSNFFSLPKDTQLEPCGSDYFNYGLTITDGNRSNTVWSDFSCSESNGRSLHILVNFVENLSDER